MQNLRDTILEKMSINSITFNKFPIDRNLSDMIKFLKDNNFIIIEEGEPVEDFIVRKRINNEHKRICFVYKFMNYFQLRFADTSKKEVSTENPIFILYKANVSHKNIYTYRIYTQYTGDYKDLDKEEWIELVNKHFS